MRIAGGRSVGRGQAIQLGALLLFAILIINLSLFQVFVVPDQNGEIEFKHSQQVQEELKGARNAVFQTSVTGTDLTTSVQLAPQYPSRTVFVNPAPPAGSLRTESLGGVSFGNIDPANAETREFWDASTPTPTTSRLVYQPGYNLYTAPDTVYESSVIFNTGDGAPDRTLTGQSIVNGRRISLVTLTGNVGTTSTGTESLEFKGVSASNDAVPVRGGSGPLQVTIPTTLSESEWEELLSEQLDGDNTGVGVPTDGDGQFLTDIDYDDDTDPATVTLTFEEGVQYDLRLARVGVGSGVTSPGAAYITDVQSPANVDEGGTVEYVMEVRDELNNPVSGVDVTANATDSPDDIGAFAAGSTTKTTDSDGRVSFVFDAQAGVTGTEDLVFNISDVDGSGTVEDYELVEQSLTAQSSGSDAGGDEAPPAVSDGNADPSGISQGESINLSARFDDSAAFDGTKRGGNDIFSSAWNNTNTSSTGTLSATDGQFDQAVEDVNTTIPGSTTSGWPTGENIIRINGTDANGNTNATTVTVTVTSSGGTSANQVTVSNAGATGSSGKATFDVENTGSSSVTIDGISLDSTSSNATRVAGQGGGDTELSQDMGSGERNGDIPIDGVEQPLDTNADIGSGVTDTFTLDRFQDSGGDKVDMEGESVTLTLYFTDGSSKQVTLNL
jgi:hypothetical protein